MKHQNWHAEHLQNLTIGQRAADIMRNGMGSWPFIAVFISLMVLWALINTIVLHDDSWDPYPYILLNLVLSMLAGLQGAILLIAAKRQDAISAAMARHDFETDTAAKQEIDLLIQLSQQHLTIILDVQALLQDVRHTPETPARGQAGPDESDPASAQDTSTGTSKGTSSSRGLRNPEVLSSPSVARDQPSS